MKTMRSVSLAGTVFHIEEDAFSLLKTYLDAVEQNFPEHERKEIMQEVESRIAELFSDRIKGDKKIITAKDVNQVIEILGEPKDFANQEDSEEDKNFSTGNETKRLYRDPDNRILGGVCGGMGAYFKVDPILFRILFILIALAGGSGIIIYLILWLVVPEAKTLAQKMEMKGEPFTISNLKEKFKKEYENVKSNLNL